MKPIALLFFLFSSEFCGAQELALQSTADLQSGASVRASLEWDGAFFRLLLARDSASLAFISPRLRIGPLSPEGLLRETENPLGFNAQSDVFFQASGLTPSGSVDSIEDFGFWMALFPWNGFLFMVREKNSAPAAGLILGVDDASGTGLDAAFTVSEPLRKEPAEDWYQESAPWPGGFLAHAAARAMYRSDSLSLQASGCVSAADRTLPGYFAQSCLKIGDKKLGAGAVFGIAAADYRNREGKAAQWERSAGFEAHAGDGSYTATAQASFMTGFADPANPFLPSRGCAGFSLERLVFQTKPSGPRIGAEAALRVDYDSEGSRKDEREGKLALSWKLGGEESRLQTAVSLDGPKAIADLCFPMRGLKIRFHAAVSARGAPTAAALLKARLKLPFGTLGLAAGVEDLPLAGEIPWSCIRLGVEWRTGPILDPDQEDGSS